MFEIFHFFTFVFFFVKFLVNFCLENCFAPSAHSRPSRQMPEGNASVEDISILTLFSLLL